MKMPRVYKVIASELKNNPDRKPLILNFLPDLYFVALILRHYANPTGSNFGERQGDRGAESRITNEPSMQSLMTGEQTSACSQLLSTERLTPMTPQL